MTIQEWLIPLREEHYEQWGKVLTHGRRTDPESPNGKSYWYSIDGKTGLNKMPKTELPLYAWERLNENDTYVVITEGEKDADAVLARKYVAVGTATGASGISIPCDESLKVVLGRTVYLWADNDDSGTKHMDAIADRLFKLGATDVRDIRWNEAPHKGGAADFARDYAAFVELINSAAPRETPGGDLAILLNDICRMINKYVILTPQQTDAIALWVVHTWTFEATDTTPYLWISSPEKRSGKTRLLETLEQLVREPWFTGQTSSAALFRKIDRDKPTLLFDEVDAMFKGKKELDDDLRGLLNQGHRKWGSSVARVSQSGNFEIQTFSVYCPKAIAGIGNFLPDTVADRSIRIELKRKAKPEPVARFRHRNVLEESEPIRSSLEAWADYNIEAVAQAIEAAPDLPDTLSDRAADGWEPLVAIAELAGSEWSQRTRRAAMTLSTDDDEEGSIGVRLLTDIATVFKGRIDQSNISTVDLIHELSEMDEAPWGDWYGKQIAARQLSKWLKPYGVRSRSVRISDKTPKGYRREDFVDAWSRYTPGFNATAQHSDFELESVDNELFVTANVADNNSPEMRELELDVADVAEKVLITGGSPDYSAYVQDSDDEMRFD
jgi:hypothetical protein